MLLPAVNVRGPSAAVILVLLHVLELGGDLPLVAPGAVAVGVHLGLLLGPLLAAVAGHDGLVLVVVVVLVLILVLGVSIGHREKKRLSVGGSEIVIIISLYKLLSSSTLES